MGLGEIAMNTLRHLTITGVAFAALAAAQDATPQPQHLTASFRDPAAPRKVEINLATMASLTVRGTERADVAIDYTMRGPFTPRPRISEPPPGMHRIGGSSALEAVQDGNVVRVNGGGWFGTLGDVTIQVPAQASVTIASSLGGKVLVENIAGEVEVNQLNGEITITNVSGPVVAHSTNGKIIASLSRLAPNKSVSFSTFNGDIDLTLPADAKATLKARADNGDIFTDFDVKVEPAASTPVPPAPPAPPAPGAPPAPPVPPAPRASSSAVRNQVRDQVREQVRAAVNSAVRKYGRSDYVEGTINGGGTEVQFTTFNGRILIHKK
jgi:hypothetical protein